MRWLWIALACATACGDDVTPPARGVQVVGNESAACALDEAGLLYCWGRLHGNQVGVGEQGDPATGLPSLRFPDFRWQTVSVTAGHACGIRDDGTLWCWGRNCAGQLGDGTRDAAATPVQVGTQTAWTSITTGGGHSCAIDVDGSLMCWGGIDRGQQDCETAPSVLPSRIAGRWKQVSSSWYTTHAIDVDGTLWRWNDYRIEEDPRVPYEEPVQVGTATWSAIASGLNSVYGVRADRTLASVLFDSVEEVQIGSETGWSDTIAARDHACALKLDGSLHCWGRNDFGQVGTGLSTEDVVEPKQLGTFAGWTSVNAGWANSCGVYQGQVYCWGMNAEGELGLGMPYDHLVRPPSRIGVEL